MDWIDGLRLFLVLIGSSLAGSLVFAYSFKVKVKAKPNEIKPPKICIYSGILFIIGIVVIIYFCLQNKDDIVYIIFLVPLFLVGFWLMFHGIFWRIELKEDTFIYRNRIGRKKEYRYEEVTAYKEIKYGTIRMYINNKKRITVDYWNSNLDDLNKKLYEKFLKPKTPYISKKKRKDEYKKRKRKILKR